MLRQKPFVHSSQFWTAFLCAILIVVTGATWSVLDGERDNRLRTSLLLVAQKHMALFAADLGARLPSLRRAGHRWLEWGEARKAESIADANSLIADYPGLESVEWEDGGSDVTWTASHPGSEHAQPVALAIDADHFRVHKAMRDFGAKGGTPGIVPFVDGKTIFFHIPIVSRMQIKGFVLAGLNIPNWLDYVFPDRGARVTSTFLTVGGVPLSEKPENAKNAYPASSVSIGDRVAGLDVFVEESPLGSFLLLNKSWLPEWVLISGLLLTGLLTGFMFLYQRSLSATGNALAVGRVWKLSENRIATILTSAPSGIITIGEDGRIRTANPAAEDMFGFTIGEMRGENVKMLMPEPFHNEHDRYLQQYLASGEKHAIGIGRQVVGRRKDGSTFPVDLEVGEMDMEGERQFTAILHDSSTRQRTERQLLEAKQQAEAASKAKSQFLANMSHELRAPLNAIIGYSQLLQFENKRGQKDRITKEINRAGEHLLALINRVLDLARIESGKIEVSVESVSLSEIFKDCFSVIWPMAEKAAVEIKMDCAELYVQCDRLRIKQVLINLLTNAVKYNRPNGEISLRCERSEAGRVRIQVTNSGVGLTEEGIRHIFEPFERLGADATRVEGTGIGLTISKQLVELMDGTLGVESTLDVTTTFSVDLPEGSRPPGDGMVQETSFGEDLATPRSGRVLVLEDNPMNQRVLREQLETLGQYVSMAANGEEGLRQWRTGAFDLVLSDIRMPVMDGYEFIRALRALEVEQHLGRTKVVGVSGLAMAEERTRCLSAGMDDCMTKPIDFKKLKRDLIAWLGEPALVAAVPA